MKFTAAIDEYLADMRSQGRINSPRTERSYYARLLMHADDVANRSPRTTNRTDVKRTLRRWQNPNTQLYSYGDYASAMWDPRNALRLCVVPLDQGSNCHYQHENARRRVRLGELTPESLDFAFEVLGPPAYDYLQRHYRCDSEGVEAQLEPRLRKAQDAAH